MSGSLHGVRVVDFGQYMAGPLAGMLLADQGAEVIRVDPPGGPRWDTPAAAVWNRGKRSVIADLRTSTGLELARRLAETADVLLENFRPGVMERLGLGADGLMAARPGLVYCSMPGFAADDPRAGLPGWEGVVSAAAAAYSPLPRPGEAPGGGVRAPVFSAVPVASGFAAFLAATGVTAALRARERLGCGQRLEIPLFDAMFVALGFRAMGLPGAGGGGGGGGGGGERLAALLATRPARDWEDLGEVTGAEVAMARTSAQWLREPHARQSGLVIEVDDPRYGVMLQPGPAVTMSASPGGVRFAARAAGADQEAVAGELAGVSEAGLAGAGLAEAEPAEAGL